MAVLKRIQNWCDGSPLVHMILLPFYTTKKAKLMGFFYLCSNCVHMNHYHSLSRSWLLISMSLFMHSLTYQIQPPKFATKNIRMVMWVLRYWLRCNQNNNNIG